MKHHLLTVFLILLFPYTLWANLDGVYNGTFQKNGYECIFNADLIQTDHKSITFKKWTTECESGSRTIINGPMTFTFIGDNEVEVKTNDDISYYKTTKRSLSEHEFHINYTFEAFAGSAILKYDILINLKLEDSLLKFDMRYLQNDQLIFSDRGLGNKRASY